MVVIFGNFGSQLSFFASIIDYLVIVAHPAARRIVRLIGVQVFVSICHIFLLYHTLAKMSNLAKLATCAIMALVC